MPLDFCLRHQVGFEPVGKVTKVFFDDRNRQVFSVRSGGATGLMARGFADTDCANFRLDVQPPDAAASPISTIKLSPDQKLLAVQRRPNQVEFFSLAPAASTGPSSAARQMIQLEKVPQFSQAAKGKNTVLFGFSWIGQNDIMYVTDHGLEIYTVVAERQLLKSVRAYSQTVAWSVCCPRTGLVVTSGSAVSSTLQPLAVRQGYVYKLPKIEVAAVGEGAAAATSGPAAAAAGRNNEVREKDVGICTLHEGQVYVTVIVHQQQRETEIHLYAVAKDLTTVKRAHVLRVPAAGPLALNIVDNLVIAHHQLSESSYVFDVALPGDFDGTVTRHAPVCCGRVMMSGAGVHAALDSLPALELYSPNWVTFPPNVVVDAKVGLMWRLGLELDAGQVSAEIRDLATLVTFLQQRDGAKMVLLDVLLERFRNDVDTRLNMIETCFDLINEEYAKHLNERMQSNMALPASTFTSPSFKSPSSSSLAMSAAAAAAASVAGSPVTNVNGSSASSKQIPRPKAKVVLDQHDLYTHIFTVLLQEQEPGPGDDNPSGRLRRLCAIVQFYFKSLTKYKIKAHQFLDEFYASLYVKRREYFQLHQLLQYRVFSDSKPMACLLLSLETVYPAAYQLAMDMLHRLGNSKDEICEILLSKQQVVTALKYANANGLDHIPARKFLEAAIATGDKHVFYNVHEWYSERGVLARAGFERYNKHYQKVWGEKAGAEKNTAAVAKENAGVKNGAK